MAFYDQRQPGLTLQESEKYQNLKLGMHQAREKYAEEQGLDLWQKSIDDQKKAIEKESKRLSNFDASEFLSETLENSPSSLPGFVKVALYRANPNFFPDSKQKIIDNWIAYGLSEHSLDIDQQDIEEQEKLLKEYTTLTMPTSASNSKMNQMREFAKVVFDNEVARPKYGPQMDEIDRSEAVIEAAKALKSDNLPLHRERELELLNESSRNSGGLPQLSFAPEGPATGLLRRNQSGSPQVVSFNDTSWLVLQSKNKNYLVPHMPNAYHVDDKDLTFVFRGSVTEVGFADDKSFKESYDKNGIYGSGRYYENERPHEKLIVAPELAKEIERLDAQERRENAMKGMHNTLNSFRSR